MHAADPADLPHYYARYPTFPEDDIRSHGAFAGQLSRMLAAGLEPEHRILDYGCGSGGFVRYLKGAGYAHVAGYDLYEERYCDPALLDQRYDCIVSQDVLEHVPDPRAWLARLGQLVKPGGLICLGTPDAAAVDLARAESYVHVIHAPYHRHIFSSQAVREAASGLGWSLSRFYPKMYGSSLRPAANTRFGLHYMRCHDDCLDLLTEPFQFSWGLVSPVGLFHAFFGYFFDRNTDVTFMFRTQPESAAP